MAFIRLRYVTTDRDRHGNLRLYFRRPGAKKIRLRGLPGSDEFMEAYRAAVNGKTIERRRVTPIKPGSFRSVCTAYCGSPEFKLLDQSTQKWRRRALDDICETHGENPIALLNLPRHIKKLRDEKADKPSVANTRLKALRAMFSWALEADLVDVDPTKSVKLIRYVTKGHHSWEPEEIAKFEERHKVGTKARLAMALLRFTTGRREDAVRFGRQHVKDGRIRYTQAKNEHRKPVKIDIPLHPDLAAIIAATPPEHLTFLVTDYGKPFTAPGFGNKFRTWCDEAGLPHCSAHGLRKATATALAEMGATPHEIMAVTDHQTLEEVERYTKAARNRVLADSAMTRLKSGTGIVPPK